MAKKRGTGSQIKIIFTNRWLYTLIAIGILAIISVGVYAWTDANGVGHDLSEIQPCEDGQILQTSGTSWICVDALGGTAETDPTVQSDVKDGIIWSEIGSIPADIADGDDLGDHIATQDLNLNNHKITSLVSPTSSADAATKSYVDAQGGGGNYKESHIYLSYSQKCLAGWIRITSIKCPYFEVGHIFCCEPNSPLCYQYTSNEDIKILNSGEIVVLASACIQTKYANLCCR